MVQYGAYPLRQVAGASRLFLMKSTDFYRQILGISAPWKIVNVELDMEAKRVVITAEVDRATQWAHPETKQAASLHQWTERTWRHLDTCQFETVIKANVPSVKHRDGSIEEVAVPWADRYQRITQLLAQAVIIWLQACGNVAIENPRCRAHFTSMTRGLASSLAGTLSVRIPSSNEAVVLVPSRREVRRMLRP